MKNLHVLHYLASGEARELPWELNLTQRGIVLLACRSLGEAAAFCRAYPMMLIIVDLAQWDEHLPDAIAQLALLSPDDTKPAMVGLLRFEPDAAQRAALIDAKLDGLLGEHDPARFMLWPIELMTRLKELSAFEQTRIDVGQLAHQTRQQLHDLSQPLSAIQGHLQLLAAKCDDDDPNAHCLKEMVRLIFAVSQQVMDMQRMHRTYSS